MSSDTKREHFLKFIPFPKDRYFKPCYRQLFTKLLQLKRRATVSHLHCNELIANHRKKEQDHRVTGQRADMKKLSSFWSICMNKNANIFQLFLRKQLSYSKEQ